MKEIQLSQNKVSLVDDEDFEFLNQYKWYASTSNKIHYAQRQIYTRLPNGKYRGKKIWMHRLITGADENYVVDHIDHDGLNNQKTNLRLATVSKNAQNKHKKCNSASAYKGLTRSRGKWQTLIKHNGRSIFLGRFENEKDAALAYNKKALELFGEFAYLNKIEESL